MQTIYQQELVSVLYHPTLDLLHVKWAGDIKEDKYREVMREMIRLTKELQIRNWLFNMDQAEQIQISDKDWTTEFIASGLLDSSLRRIARVDSRNWNYEQYVRRMVAEAHTKHTLPIETKFFDTEHEALAWLANATPADITVN